MLKTKDDIHRAIDQLPPEKIEAIANYLEKMMKKELIQVNTVVNMEALNYVKKNYSNALKGLVDR